MHRIKSWIFMTTFVLICKGSPANCVGASIPRVLPLNMEYSVGLHSKDCNYGLLAKWFQRYWEGMKDDGSNVIKSAQHLYNTLEGNACPGSFLQCSFALRQFLRRHSSKEYRIMTIQMWQKQDGVHALTVFRIFSTLLLMLWRQVSLSRTEPQHGLSAQSPSPEENVARQNDVTVLMRWLKCGLKIAAFACFLFKTQKWSK